MALELAKRLQILEDAEATRILTLEAILERERIKPVEAEVVVAHIERMESALRYMADDKVQLAPSGYRAIAVAALSPSDRPSD